MPAAAIRTTELPSGATIPVLGQGTWRMGEGDHPARLEIAALRLGLDLGMTLVDTAEMYGWAPTTSTCTSCIGAGTCRWPRQWRRSTSSQRAA